jgi:hypothetical protein
MLQPKCVEYLLSYQVTPDRVRPTTAVQHIYKYVWARGEDEDEEEEVVVVVEELFIFNDTIGGTQGSHPYSNTSPPLSPKPPAPLSPKSPPTYLPSSPSAAAVAASPLPPAPSPPASFTARGCYRSVAPEPKNGVSRRFW